MRKRADDRHAAWEMSIYSLDMPALPRNALLRNGIRTVNLLHALSDADLRRVPGIGKVNLRHVRESLTRPRLPEPAGPKDASLWYPPRPDTITRPGRIRVVRDVRNTYSCSLCGWQTRGVVIGIEGYGRRLLVCPVCVEVVGRELVSVRLSIDDVITGTS